MELDFADGNNLMTEVRNLIIEAGLFDRALYCRQAGLSLDLEQGIDDYLLVGEKSGYRPSSAFDPEFYGEAYPDVVLHGMGRLEHFVRYGRAEGRYPTRAALQEDVRLIKFSGICVPEEFAAAQVRSAHHGFTIVEDHLLGRWKVHRLTNNFLDTAYLQLNSDVLRAQQPPIIHFIKTGSAQGRLAPKFRPAEFDALKSLLHEEHYRRQTDVPKHMDAVMHYLLEGRWKGLSPAPRFNPAYYLAKHRDIWKSGFEPYVHYTQFGRAEGRLPAPDFAAWRKMGGDSYDSLRPTLVIATHETSRSGAPLVALELARHLRATYNIIFLSRHSAGLDDDFLALCVAMYTGRPDSVDAEWLIREIMDDFAASVMLLNSVETCDLAEGALLAGLPSVGLIHEFAEYSSYKVTRMVAVADRVVFPADLVLRSALAELSDAGRPNNVSVRSQGVLTRLPSAKSEPDMTREEILDFMNAATEPRPKVVLGAGGVYIRKGVDLFIQTAAEMRNVFGDDFRFLWVGEGFRPKDDFNYSFWLQDAIDRLGLSKNIYFLKAQGSLDAVFSVSDAFFLSSRLDPFPNVALDALEAGKPVVCFEEATGIADWIKAGDIVGTAVPFLDLSSAAAALSNHLTRSDAARTNASAAARAFRFADYAAHVGRMLSEAQSSRAEQVELTRQLAETHWFDAMFFNGGVVSIDDRRFGMLRYVSLSSKGLSELNPYPGFSDNLYRSRLRDDERVTLPVLAPSMSHDSDGRPTTHRCLVLGKEPARAAWTGRVASHLHLHYSELAGEFAERIARIGLPMDLFITTREGKARAEVEAAFGNYGLGSVKVFECPNRGRDIGPFLTLLGDDVVDGRYDLIGHFHGKKSLTVPGIPLGTGDKWREFLLDTLLGDPADVAAIFGAFAEDPNLGLAFAEDRKAVSWGDNETLAAELAGRLSPRPKLPKIPLFPLGNMFWARPAAIASVWELKLHWRDYPAEPAPSDGTVLHALERMLPAICEAAGHSWTTVHKPGVAW